MCFSNLQIPSLKARAFFKRGKELCLNKQFHEGLQYFDKTLRLYPQYVNVWNHKGITFYNLEKFEEAIDCFDKAIEIKPKYTQAWNNKGITLIELDKIEESINCFNKILDYKPMDINAWNNKGKALVKLAKFEDALNCFETAINITKKYSTIWKDKSKTLLKKNKTRKAAEYLNISKKFRYNNVDALINKGEILCELGRFEEGIKCIEIALKLKPDDFNLSKKKEDWKNQSLKLEQTIK